ncbi:MAG: EAL domain-containing protein [Clostridiales bacterium]|nr:EAL domain-containing protein [Clostridiales bacterium]
MSPADFIPVAEESNLIIDIGAWVLKEACRFIKSFNEQNGTDFSVSVNISGHQLLSEGFEAYVDELLSTTGIKPENLEFEITESILLHSMNVVSKKLSGFQARNLKIALDDFGTGYSSLTYLKVLPINIIKIDKSFVDDITNNTQSFNILSNIVQIARHIGLKIVVEGIETYDQVKLIAQLDCDSIQGYYFSRPLPVEEIPAALEKLHKLP